VLAIREWVHVLRKELDDLCGRLPASR
jgi:hypothetical protein